jgi:hypothetical protein
VRIKQMNLDEIQLFVVFIICFVILYYLFYLFLYNIYSLNGRKEEIKT